MQSDFWKRFDNVLSGISVLKSYLQRPTNRITEAEDRIGWAEDTLDTMHNTTNLLQERCAMLEKKTVEDQENRALCNNLQLICFPDKAEGSNMCTFLEKNGLQQCWAWTLSQLLPLLRWHTDCLTA